MAATLIICKFYKVTVVNSSPYHPQLQESVESANRTFKR